MNYYSKVIDILQADSSDWKSMIIDIAKKHPKLVCDAFDVAHKVSWRVKARELIASDLFVAAIKFCRDETGLGLADAKHECDIIKEQMARGQK